MDEKKQKLMRSISLLPPGTRWIMCSVGLEIEKECEGDFDKIYTRAVEVQKKLTDRLVSSPMNPAREKQAHVEVERA